MRRSRSCEPVVSANISVGVICLVLGCYRRRTERPRLYKIFWRPFGYACVCTLDILFSYLYTVRLNWSGYLCRIFVCIILCKCSDRLLVIMAMPYVHLLRAEQKVCQAGEWALLKYNDIW